MNTVTTPSKPTISKRTEKQLARLAECGINTEKITTRAEFVPVYRKLTPAQKKYVLYGGDKPQKPKEK